MENNEETVFRKNRPFCKLTDNCTKVSQSHEMMHNTIIDIYS